MDAVLLFPVRSLPRYKSKICEFHLLRTKDLKWYTLFWCQKAQVNDFRLCFLMESVHHSCFVHLRFSARLDPEAIEMYVHYKGETMKVTCG